MKRLNSLDDIINDKNLDKNKIIAVVEEFDFSNKLDREMVKQSIAEDLPFIEKKEITDEVYEELISLLKIYQMILNSEEVRPNV